MNRHWQWFTAKIRGYLARLDDESGQGLVEYALILTFVSILVILATHLMVPALMATFNNVSNSL